MWGVRHGIKGELALREAIARKIRVYFKIISDLQREYNEMANLYELRDKKGLELDKKLRELSNELIEKLEHFEKEKVF